MFSRFAQNCMPNSVPAPLFKDGHRAVGQVVAYAFGVAAQHPGQDKLGLHQETGAADQVLHDIIMNIGHQKVRRVV